MIDIIDIKVIISVAVGILAADITKDIVKYILHRIK